MGGHQTNILGTPLLPMLYR